MRALLLLLLAAQPLLAVDFDDPRGLVQTAVDKHPALAALRSDVAGLRERVGAAGQLPNPMLMGGIQNKMIDLRDDEMMTMYMVGASQRLVWGDKREARQNIARLEADALELQLDSLRAEIERDVLLAWYEAATADAQIAATRRVGELVDALTAAARVRYEVGTAGQADVIRAQLEKSALEQELLRLRAARRAALARLLPLLDLPFDTNVPPIAMPEGTDDLAIGASVITPEEHPALAAQRSEMTRADEQARLARADARPDVDLEAQYGYRRMQKDMFSVTARIELPLRNDVRIEPRIREAILRREAAQARIGQIRRSVSQALAEAVVAHEETTEQLKFHQAVLVPQAQLAFSSTLAAYQTGQAPFDAVLATETAYLRLQLQYFNYLARHAQAVVNYEALQRGARSASMSASAPAASAATPSTTTGASMGAMQ
jgi:outer membrane protein TolC